MTAPVPLDPFSEAVDTNRRWTPDWYSWLTQLVQEVISAALGKAPATASFVTLGTDPTLTSERVLTAGTGISLTDNGAGNTLVIGATMSSAAPIGASYVTLGTDATLTSERVLTAGTNITLTDGGPGGTLTIASTSGGGVSSARQINTTEGVQGGGDLSVDRTHKLDINGLTEDTTPDSANDFVASYDASAGVHKKVKITNISGTGGVPNSRQILTTGGIQGGGDLSADRTLSLNIDGLSFEPTFHTSDEVALYSTVDATHYKQLVSALSNDKAFKTITISTTEGIQGGGDLTTNRTHKLDINGLTEDTTPDLSNDFLASYDASAGVHKKVRPTSISVPTSRQILTTEGIQGGGDLSVDRTHKLNISALTEDFSPDLANDFVATWDNSAGVHKKARPQFLLPPGGIKSTILLTYGVSVATNALLGNNFLLHITNSTGFSIANPTNPTDGQTITYTIFNDSGGPHGTITWGFHFKKSSFTGSLVIDNGFNLSISFLYDGTDWRETYHSAVEIVT